MTSKLGLHWLRVHPDGRDYSHIEKMQYRSAKLFEWHWSNRDACRDLLAVLPKDSYILARDHPLSEQEIWSDPVGIGTRHANEWAMKVANGQVFTPIDRTFFLGRNEPDATTGDRNAIDLYTDALLDRLRVHGLRGGAFNFSTGHPRTVDGTGGTQADYTVFERSHQAIVRGHHIAVLHIYGTGAVPCAPGHFDRLKACTWQDVEWVVGEMGADEHVVGGGKHDGYLISMASNPPAYCAWLDTLIIGINDPRIHSYQVFSYDYSHPWSSFDTRPIRDALESHQWRHMQVQPTPQPTTPPVTVHIPSVGTGTPSTPAYIVVKAGANLRSAPITGQIITAVPYGERIDIIGVMDTSGWLRVRYRDHEGYMAAQLVGLVAPEPLPAPSEGPEPTPVPEPSAPIASGIIDPRVAQAILRIESGGRTHGENGKPIIRFEAHIFKQQSVIDDWERFFRTDAARPWVNQEWRRSENDAWKPIHTGTQANEYAVFDFAKSLDTEGAHLSISMGAAQIMGFNYARIGYPSAQAMFKSFQDAPMQTIGFINFLLSDAKLFEAVRNRDWREIARRFNGGGAVDTYAPLLQKAYEELA